MSTHLIDQTSPDHRKTTACGIFVQTNYPGRDPLVRETVETAPTCPRCAWTEGVEEEEHAERLAATCGFCGTRDQHTDECVDQRRKEEEREEWNRNRRTHSWATLDGEEFSCSFCDTKTGREPCPEGRMLDAQIDAHLQAEHDERRSDR